MGVTKGIVSGGNYTFDAVAKTITFSNDYLGMSLSDITYITNIKSGVATVIYDPFDPLKGGVLNGLVLTLAFNTTGMSNTDPLQIIVGFTPNTATPQNVSLSNNNQLGEQINLLESIAESADLLAKATDLSERIEVNTRVINSEKRDIDNAQVISDGVQSNKVLSRLNDYLLVDTAGYKSVEFYTNGLVNANVTVSLSSSPDGVRWDAVPYVEIATTNSVNAVGAGLTVTQGNTRRFVMAANSRYARAIITAYTSGSILVIATLKQTQLPTGPFTQIPITGAVSVSSTITGLTAGAGLNNQAGGVFTGGAAAPGSSTVYYPIINGGREAPYTGFLAGITRSLLTDSQGRYILGGDYDATRPRDPISGLAQGPYGNAPVRGVGGRQNTMHGSQALLVEDVGQSEGDTMPTLLQQILVELKMLNQQLNELPLNMNLGIKMQNEVSEYRTEEYNNHVNNQ